MELLKLKNELKEIAFTLKTSKLKLRNQSSEIDKNKIAYWGSIQDKEFLNNHWKLDSQVTKLRIEFRHKLIAYCLLRGMEYKRVEKSCREDNEPNWNFIEEIKNEYSN